MKRMRRVWKKRIAGLGAAGITGIMAGVAPVSSLASSPDFAKSAQEWERLRDNVLEYEEIGDLIHEYNVTVQNNQYEYNTFIKDYGRTKEDVSSAYRDLADKLEENRTGEDGMGMVSDFQLEQQAKQLREQADDNLEDSKIYYLNFAQAEANLVLSAQSKFLSYYKTQLELESARWKKKELESSYALLQIQQQAGTVTEIEMFRAQEAVQEQEKTIAELEQQMENTRQSLMVMCGWKGSDQPHIEAVPALKWSEIDTIDLEADIQLALENNYTLQINKRKLENAKDTDNQENLKKTIASNERQIQQSVTSAWQNLQTARRTYDQAVSAKELEEQNQSLAAQKYSAGMLTPYEDASARIALQLKELEVQTALLELQESLETYRWNVKGLASAG